MYLSSGIIHWSGIRIYR